MYKLDKDFNLSKYEYLQTQLKIACLLRPDLKDPVHHEDLKKILEEDWNRDIEDNKQKMSLPTLERSLFEMADIWTAGLKKEE